MSDTNAKINPFEADTSGAQAGLYKGIGVTLAVTSGIFIGSSFVFKKKGLLQSVDQSGGTAGEGYRYLKSTMWWTGMILMIVGELCNFIAYAFTQAILVTPLGALSVVISAVLSSIFLKEKLSFQGKIGCLQCILGAVMIVVHAPEQSSADTTIEAFKKLVLSVGFLVYAGLATVVSFVLIFYCGPKWGKKNMLVYISVCSLIGSISVVFTQGLGAAVVHSISRRENQFTNWFIYLVLAAVIITLVVEIVYLNKALNLFNTALVTPTYYVIFTTMTIVSSIVLYRGFDASPVDVVTCVLGFLGICSGVALLHNSKSQPDSSERLLNNMEQNEDNKKRPRGLLWFFENKDNINEKNTIYEQHALAGSQHGGNDPGAADLFPAPFSGISRYASTTRKTQTMSSRIRLQSSIELNPVSVTKCAATNQSYSNLKSTVREDSISKFLNIEKRLSDGGLSGTNESLENETANQEQINTIKRKGSDIIPLTQGSLNNAVPVNEFYTQTSERNNDNRQKITTHSRHLTDK